MNAETLKRHISGDFRFSPKKCREAGLNNTAEAKFLRFLLVHERTNREVQAHFGVALAYYLASRGLVANKLAEVDTAHTNLWRLTPRGLAVLARAAGISQEEVTHV